MWLLNDSALKGRQHYFAHGRATSALESRQHYFAHPSSMSECARDYRQEARRMRSVNQQVRGGGAAATGSTPLPGWQTFLTAAATVVAVVMFVALSLLLLLSLLFVCGICVPCGCWWATSSDLVSYTHTHTYALNNYARSANVTAVASPATRDLPHLASTHLASLQFTLNLISFHLLCVSP